MKLGRKSGVVRRPIEYVLPAVVVLLIAVLLLAVDTINKSSQENDTDKKDEISSITGSFDEVDKLTEEDIRTEETIDKKYDQSEELAASADDAADDFGSIYDETEY